MSSHTGYLRRGAVSLGLVAAGGFLADYVFNLGLTRFLSPHDYGDLKVAFAFATFVGLAVLLGGDRAAPMVLAPRLERGEPRKVWQYLRFYLGNALWLGVAVAVVVWAVSWLHVGSAHPKHHHPLAWVVLVIPINAAGAMMSRTLQSSKRPAQAALPWRIGLPAMQLALFGLVVLIQGGLGLVEAVLIGMVPVAAITAGQWIQVRRLGLVEVAGERERGEERRWLVASLPMMGSFLVALALNQSDIYFMEMLGDDVEVGRYAAAATIAHVVLLIQTTVVGLLAPIARPAIDAGEQASRSTFRQGQLLMLGLLVPVCASIALAADPILGLFGTGYRDGHTVLLFLVAGNFSWALAALPSLWLQYRGRAGVVLTISLVTLVVDSGLDLVLIPRYGMNGAAASTAATLTGAALAAIVAFRRTR